MYEKERNLDISEWGYAEPVVVKRLTAGEKARLNNSLAKINNFRLVGKEVQGELQPGTTDLVTACAFIKSGPFPANLSTLEALDSGLVDAILEAGKEINPDFREKKENNSESASSPPGPGEGHPTVL